MKAVETRRVQRPVEGRQVGQGRPGKGESCFAFFSFFALMCSGCRGLVQIDGCFSVFDPCLNELCPYTVSGSSLLFLDRERDLCLPTVPVLWL